MPLHTVSFLVENRPGVLFKVSNLFRRRGYNITSLTVGPVEGSPLSRMTVVVDAESRVLNQIVEQLDKMVDVVKVKRLDPIRTLSRELLLIKLKTSDPMARIEAVNTVNAYHGLILDVEPDILIAEVTGPTDEIDEFLRKIGPIGIEEMSRTGAAAIERGNLKLA
ncbi:MAG: acetolactate synthase small subunit [Candidatus Bathyarchaeia archaeon]